MLKNIEAKFYLIYFNKIGDSNKPLRTPLITGLLYELCQQHKDEQERAIDGEKQRLSSKVSIIKPSHYEGDIRNY